MVKVDIVTPTYKRQAVLDEYLAMLAAQTFQNFRVLLVNDDPATSLEARIEPWKNRLDIVLLEPGINQKAAAARNFALSHATAPYIALCDDDDYWHPFHLEQLVATLDSGDVDLAYAAVNLVQSYKSPKGRQLGEQRLFAFLPDPAFLRSWNTIPISGQVYRRELHQQLGNFDTAIPHYADWDWNLRVAESGARVKLSLPVSVNIMFDVDGDNQSGDPANMASELALLVKKHHLGELPSSNYWLMLEVPEVAQRIVPV